MYFKNIILLNSWDFFVILKDYHVDIQMSVSNESIRFIINYLVNCMYLIQNSNK